MSTDAEQIKRDIEATRSSLSDHVDELAYQARPGTIAKRQVSKAKQAGSRLLDRVLGAADDARESAAGSIQQAGDSVTDKAKEVGYAVADAPQAVRRQTVGNPIAAGLVAFGFGLLLAAAFPASDKERDLAETVKEKVEPVKEHVVEAAKQVADNLSEPASQAVQDLKDRAGEAVENVRAEGTAAADDVKQSAADAAEESKQTFTSGSGSDRS